MCNTFYTFTNNILDVKHLNILLNLIFPSPPLLFCLSNNLPILDIHRKVVKLVGFFFSFP